MATNFESVFGGGVPLADPFGPLGGGGGMDMGAIAPTVLPAGGSPAPQSPLEFVRDVTADPGLPPAELTPVKKLKPGSDLLGKTLEKLDAMFLFSHSKMSNHYDRWNLNEMKIQAYTGLEDYKQIVEGVNTAQRAGNARPPEPMQIVVPYTYATLHAAATFVATVLLGRKPVFPLLATRGTESERGRYMEQALQQNLDASRGYEALWQHIWDSLVYSFAPTRVAWEERNGAAIRWIAGRREQTTEMTFAGNVIGAIDPYRYFPDPRVPLHQCNERGDFIFTEMSLSETVLRDMQKADSLAWVDETLAKAGTSKWDTEADKNRRRVRIGDRGDELLTPANVVGFRKLREGTVRLVPKEWGLGDSDRSELWKFTWIKGAGVMQAEPLGMVHAQHPYTCSEPTSLGHDFMSLSMAEMIGTFQDVLSWLVTSRMENVRSSINNQFIADPGRVELNDIRSSTIGRIIRLKQAAMGLPIDQAIQQLVVQDVTQGHMGDIQTMRILADTITGVNDNLRGIQTAGGRRSATEARMAMQSGGSRLSQLAVRISSQALQPMVQQMIMNVQQFMPESMWMEVTGDAVNGQPESLKLTPDMLVGAFNYQVSDGSLPFDKTALLEVWKEILFGVAQDPELRQRYDLGEIFDYTAELGGAKNIDSFKRPPPPMTSAVADPAADPNLAAIGPAMPAAPMMAGMFG